MMFISPALKIQESSSGSASPRSCTSYWAEERSSSVSVLYRGNCLEGSRFLDMHGLDHLMDTSVA